ncbi:chaperonin 10-like protein [Mycena galericulata]|nr:chaperonin 10-like protein [Mycena galericulata]
MPTHTAIAALGKGQSDAIEVEMETPGAGQVLLKVAYASMIAFDTWTWAAVGRDVTSLAVGDRITAFSLYGQGRKDGLKGTMQEFVVLPDHLCAKIPDSLPLDAAATIPDNFVTAFFTLFDQLSLPVPRSFPATIPPPDHDLPILIYGAGSTTAQYAIQLLHAAGYTNVIATASPKHHPFLRALGATSVLDYNSATLRADAAAAAGRDGKIALALDAISATGTIARVAPLMRAESTLALLMPIKDGDTVAVGDTSLLSEIPPTRNPFPPETKIAYVRTFFKYRENEYLWDNLMPKILPELLAAGIIQPNRVRLLDQGTLKERVAVGLDLLRNTQVSGEKVVVKVA